MNNGNNNIFFNGLPDFEQQEIEEKMRARQPKAPSFSLDDMEKARKDSFAQGQKNGLQMAKDSIEQKTEILVQSIINNVHDIETKEIQRQQDYINNAISIAHKAILKFLPALLDDQKEQLIKNALSDFMDEHTPKTTLTLYVHPNLEKPIQKHAKTLSPTIEVKIDKSLSESQSRMEWADGAFEFTPDLMVQNILDIVNEKINTAAPVVDESEKIEHNETSDEGITPEIEEEESHD